MRLAQLLPMWGLAGWACTAAWAQISVPPAVPGPAPTAHGWIDPAAPVRPLLHSPLPHSGAVVEAAQDWHAANAAVAEFPRGHSDVLRWEAAQQGKVSVTAPAHKGHP